MKAHEILRNGSPVAQVAARVDAETDSVASLARWPDPLAKEAFHGIGGRIVHAIEPHSEADPAALLVQFLVGFGSIIGRGPYFQVEADRHHTNLFAVIVGTTSKGRKGTSWGQSKRMLGSVDPTWLTERLSSGLSSGEGLIWAVRDPIQKNEPIREKSRVVGYQEVIADPGVADKRLLAVEAEFASTLQVIRREGNNLSALVRQAWDSGNLRSLTKNSPATATGAHISIIAHITKPELLRQLDSTETGNGFANRFLWVMARRVRSLPDGGRIDSVDWTSHEKALREAVEFARSVTRMERDEGARRIWHAVYDRLSDGQPGLLGAVISRAEAQVIRLSCLYALLDRSERVRAEHMKAALAVWEYAEASARFIFGAALGDPLADTIHKALLQSSAGLTRTEIRDLFGRNKGNLQIERALATLQEYGLAEFEKDPTSGRPAERWVARVVGHIAEAGGCAGDTGSQS